MRNIALSLIQLSGNDPWLVPLKFLLPSSTSIHPVDGCLCCPPAQILIVVAHHAEQFHPENIGESSSLQYFPSNFIKLRPRLGSHNLRTKNRYGCN